MKIIIDAFGGDNAPLAPLQGARMAARKYDLDIIAVGDIEKMEKCCAENSIDRSRIEFLQADSVFEMERDPMEIVKKRTDTSLHVAFKALSEGKGDAVVSAGSTGRILMGATFIVKRIKGCKRPAIGSVMPCETPGGFMLIDSGANTETRPEMLRQFGVMGSVYMEKVTGRSDQTLYHYAVWKDNNDGVLTDEDGYIFRRGDVGERRIRITVNAPNETWYLTVEEADGWGSLRQMLPWYIGAFFLLVLLTYV